VHVACPQCGTGYQLEPATLERPRLRLRCRRCRHLWDPRQPFVEDESPADAAPATLVDEADAAPETASGPAATAAPGAPRRRLAAMLYALAGLSVLASGAGFGWAYRDVSPFTAPPLPTLTEVEPAWTRAETGRRLVVSARVENPGDAATAIRRVRIKFLSAEGAWIDEIVVEVPALTVPAGGTGEIEMAVDRLPEGTASLELSVVPAAPLS
jgi:predicted Zn finger-like uncharacterized protein